MPPESSFSVSATANYIFARVNGIVSRDEYFYEGLKNIIITSSMIADGF